MRNKCSYCDDLFADPVDFAYHLVDDHKEEVLNDGSDTLPRFTKDVVYLLIEADNEDLIGFVRE